MLPLILSCLWAARRRRSAGAVAGPIDLDPDLVDCAETLFELAECRARLSFERREFQFVVGR